MVATDVVVEMVVSSALISTVPRHPSETPARHVIDSHAPSSVLQMGRRIVPIVTLYSVGAIHHLLLWTGLALNM